MTITHELLNVKLDREQAKTLKDFLEAELDEQEFIPGQFYLDQNDVVYLAVTVYNGSEDITLIRLLPSAKHCEKGYWISNGVDTFRPLYWGSGQAVHAGTNFETTMGNR